MDLVSTRLITDDIKRLVSFYEAVTGLRARWLTEDFAELSTSVAALAIGSTRTMALFGAGAARGAANASSIIEFRVDDVDALFAARREVLQDVVQAPVTQPWGNRSLLVRDPDGNLVNLFTPVSPDALAKYRR
ncbi:MAG: VOC family protein [Caulobacteraceae bacterium]|nr:VOC family protein [Caulobacter sp.]